MLQPIADKTKLTGDKKSPVLSYTDLSFDPIEAEKPTELGGPSAADLLASTDKGLDVVDKSLTQLREINASRLKGQLTPDAIGQIRTRSAGAAQMSGIGADSPAARALRARDLGLTSMQIQDAGMQAEAGLNQMQAGMAELQQKRAEFATTFTESAKQFAQNLALEQSKVQMGVKELMLRRDSFNAEQSARITGFMSDILSNRTGAAANIIMAGKNAGTVFDGLDNLITQMDTMLKMATGKA